MAMDRYAAAESFYKLGMAFAPVPDLHIMWLLHLCDAHQEMQSWAEAAQCAVAVAGVIMQVIIYKSGMCFTCAVDHLCSLVGFYVLLPSFKSSRPLNTTSRTYMHVLVFAL